MPKQIGIFVDVSNLYYCIKNKYKKKLDYGKYWNYIQDFGTIVIAKAYGAQVNNQAVGFIHCLKTVGFEPIFHSPKSFRDEAGAISKKANYDTQITVDIIENMEKLDIIVIGSADSDFVPLGDVLIKRGKKIIIFACKISRDFDDRFLCIEIPESLLEAA